MAAALLPIVLLLAVAFWGVFEAGRKFRREFKKRGKHWQEVCRAMNQGEGTIILDLIWGPQRGLGRPVIWWSSRVLTSDDDLAEEVGGAARITDCPRRLRNEQSLRELFECANGNSSRGAVAGSRVLIHSWGIDPSLLQPADEASQSA